MFGHFTALSMEGLNQQLNTKESGISKNNS